MGEMGEHPNVTVARKALQAMEDGDLETAGQYIHPDIVWHQIGGPTLNGAEALATDMAGLSGIDWDLDVHDVVGNDEHVVALVTATITAGDLEITYRTTEIYHVADGKISERWAMSDDTEAILAFFNQLEGQSV
jgi:ketosteroid isomerase-like protein